MSGKFGRRPVEPVNYARAIKFADIKPAGGILIPREMDVLATFEDELQMLGNDQYGDCVAVMLANLVFMITGVLPTYDAVIEFYKSQNPGFPQQDNGMNIQDALEHMVKTGMRMPDGTYKKAVFFAAVNHNNQDEVEDMLALFGMGAYGIAVSSRNEQEFDAGQPWTYASGDDNVGGHGVAAGGYAVDPLERRFATWAAETHWDQSFDAQRVDELWIVLFSEHVNGEVYVPGVVLSAAAAEFERVTGKPFPVVGPPGPAPGPPVPVDADSELAKAAHRYLRTRRHSRTIIGEALANWIAKKSL